jgi:hypothetical protein
MLLWDDAFQHRLVMQTLDREIERFHQIRTGKRCKRSPSLCLTPKDDVATASDDKDLILQRSQMASRPSTSIAIPRSGLLSKTYSVN